MIKAFIKVFLAVVAILWLWFVFTATDKEYESKNCTYAKKVFESINRCRVDVKCLLSGQDIRDEDWAMGQIEHHCRDDR